MGPIVLRTVLPFVVASMFVVSAAHAQPAPVDRQRATALGHEALEAYGKNDWVTAYERFAAADAAAHSPVFVLYMARCKRSAGDLLAARDLLARAAGEVLPDGASEPWKKARADAVRELAELEPRIPSVIVALRGATGPEPAVTIDDAPVRAEALRAPIRLNPGQHTVRATLPGKPPIASTVRLVEGDPPLKVELALVLDPAVTITPPAITPPAITPPPPPEKPAPKRGSLAPGLAVIGVGAAGLIAGGVMGGVALSTANDVKSRCTTSVSGGLSCPKIDEGNVNRAVGLQTAANVSFVVGGVAAAVGVVLVIVRPGGERAATARVVPGVGSIALEGTF